MISIVAGLGSHGRGDFFIRRGRQQAGDVRPSEDNRAQSTIGTGSQARQGLGDVRASEDNISQLAIGNGSSFGRGSSDDGQRAHSLIGSGSSITPSEPNGSPSRMDAMSPVMVTNIVTSSSPTNAREKHWHQPHHMLIKIDGTGLSLTAQ